MYKRRETPSASVKSVVVLLVPGLTKKNKISRRTVPGWRWEREYVGAWGSKERSGRDGGAAITSPPSSVCFPQCPNSTGLDSIMTRLTRASTCTVIWPLTALRLPCCMAAGCSPVDRERTNKNKNNHSVYNIIFCNYY